MKKFHEWLKIRENSTSWSPDRKKIKRKSGLQAQCRRCNKIYNVANLGDFFAGHSKCPECGGQGDITGNSKPEGVKNDSYPHWHRLSRLPGQRG